MWEIRGWVAKHPLRRRKEPLKRGVPFGKGHRAAVARASRIARPPKS